MATVIERYAEQFKSYDAKHFSLNVLVRFPDLSDKQLKDAFDQLLKDGRTEIGWATYTVEGRN